MRNLKEEYMQAKMTNTTVQQLHSEKVDIFLKQTINDQVIATLDSNQLEEIDQLFNQANQEIVIEVEKAKKHLAVKEKEILAEGLIKLDVGIQKYYQDMLSNSETNEEQVTQELIEMIMEKL